MKWVFVLIFVCAMWSTVRGHTTEERRTICMDAFVKGAGDAASYMDMKGIPLQYVDSYIHGIYFFPRIMSLCEGVGKILGMSVLEGRVWSAHADHTGNHTWSPHSHTILPALISAVHTFYSPIILDPKRPCFCSTETREDIHSALKTVLDNFYASLADSGFGEKDIQKGRVHDELLLDLAITPISIDGEIECTMPLSVGRALKGMQDGRFQIGHEDVSVKAVEHAMAKYIRSF